MIPYDDGGFHQLTLAPDGRLIDKFDNLPGGMTLYGRPILDGGGGASYLADPNGVAGVTGMAVYRIAAGAGKVVPIPFPPGKVSGDILDEPSLVGTPDGRLLFTYMIAGALPGGGSCDGVADVWLNEGTGDTLAPATKVMSSQWSGVPAAGACTNMKGLMPRYPAVGADAAGATTVAFQQDDSSSDSWSVGAVHRPAGGSWGPVESVGQSIEGPLRVTLAGSTPTVTVESVVVMSAARGTDGKWRQLVPLYAHFNVFALYNAMASLPDGSTVYVWTESNPLGAGGLMARRILADGTLEDSVSLTQEAASQPSIGNDAAGNVIVGFVGAGGRAQHAVFDGAGPIVDGVSIPGQGALGEQLQFSVGSARDAWSPMGSLTWLFSDGLSDTGASVAHLFSEPGTQSARLRATDALGNRTTVTGTVEVAAAPAAPAPPAAPLPPAAPRDATAPVFTTKPKVRSGVLRFALSEQATVVAVITRKATGVRRGKRCVAPPRRKTKARVCTHQVAVATVRAKLTPGAGKLTLPKKARRTKGTYTIALTVTDAAGNVTRTRTTYRVSSSRRQRTA